MISVQVLNERDVLLTIDRSQKKVVEGARRGVAKAVIFLASYIKENLLSGQVLHNRTGNLRRAITSESEDLSGRVFIGAEARYGSLHEFGVPHSWVIEARDKKALCFQVGGQTVLAKSVVHPGLPERSFMRRGLNETRDRIVDMIKQEAKP